MRATRGTQTMYGVVCWRSTKEEAAKRKQRDDAHQGLIDQLEFCRRLRSLPRAAVYEGDDIGAVLHPQSLQQFKTVGFELRELGERRATGGLPRANNEIYS
eukprot:SAG11_NODE_3002_length_2776_cov_1.699290_1_plen_101_part_00